MAAGAGSNCPPQVVRECQRLCLDTDNPDLSNLPSGRITNPCEGSPVSATVLVDLTRETMLTLAQAARRFPSFRLGRPVNPATIWRWCHEGVKLPGDEVVKLECVRVSGRWLTSVEAISRFVARQTPAPESDAPAMPRTPGRRQRAADRASAELEKLGI
jgi:hypothetical protein